MMSSFSGRRASSSATTKVRHGLHFSVLAETLTTLPSYFAWSVRSAHFVMYMTA